MNGEHNHTTHYKSSGEYGYEAGTTHDFTAHADAMLGQDALAPGQGQYGGYAFLGEYTIVARSPITGLRLVIEQAIKTVVGTQTVEQAAARYGSYEKLEAKIANVLTGLNDWGNLQPETQNEIMIQTGINFDGMTAAEQEATINHLIHSPLPFGDIDEVLSTRVKIDLGNTHTLDKNKTEVEDLGDGIWKITMISNNNNGSHTGHNLGSFKVDLGDNADAAIAKQIGNSMVQNTNNNNALYLDQAARDVLYGNSEKMDYTDHGFTHEGEGAPGQGHDFVEHLSHLMPATLAEGQDQYGGYSYLHDQLIIARSPITGMKPVFDQAINQIVGTLTLEQAAARYGGYDKLEAKIANRLTILNDWENLTEETQGEIMVMTGINIDGMSAADRERYVNHLLHSPLPFGDLQEVLETNVRIELGYTHTLDKNKTEVEDLGEGDWKITLISNNNNGSHTGHSLGSFKVNLGENADAAIAKQVGNAMVSNTNDNNKLYLDQAARDVLYGVTEQTDFDVDNPYKPVDPDGHEDHDGDGDHGDDGDQNGQTNHVHGDGNGNYLVGTAGNDHIAAMGGVDTIEGSAGNDVIQGGGAEYNQLNYSGASDAYVFTANPDGSVQVAKPDGTDTLTDIRGVYFYEDEVWMSVDQLLERDAGQDDDGTGEGPDGPLNPIQGDDGENYLLGSATDDHIEAGGGVDVIEGSAGDDVIDGGEGEYNQLNYAGPSTDYRLSVNADGSVKVVKPDGVDTLSNIQGVYFAGDGVWMGLDLGLDGSGDGDDGGSGANLIEGDENGNYLLGTDGDDKIVTGTGIDVVEGSAGNDRIIGSENDYDQVNYSGSSDDYSFVRNADGTYSVTDNAGNSDTLSHIDGVYFAGDDQWVDPQWQAPVEAMA